MIDLPDILAERLIEHGYAAGVKRLDESKPGETVVRRIPSATTDRYLDGTRGINYLVQVIAVRESEREAIEDIEAIDALIPALDLRSENGSYLLTSVETYSEPREIRPPEGGPYIWGLQLRAVITTTKGLRNA